MPHSSGFAAFGVSVLAKGRLHPFPSRNKFSPGDAQDVQIGSCKHGVQLVLVLFQTKICSFVIAKLTLVDSENVLDLAAGRGFTMLDVSVTVEGVIADLGKTFRPPESGLLPVSHRDRSLGDRYGVNQTTVSIYTTLAFHPEISLIALLRLVHF